jgi:hypothetical protein
MKPLLTFSARVLLLSLFFAAVLLTGCTKKGRPTVPVRGKVVKSGEVPLDVAQVMFFLQNDPIPLPLNPAATTEKDGTFQVSTFTMNDGLVEGEYKVTVTWPYWTVEMGQKKARGDRLNGKYSDVNTTTVKATITKGMPELVLKVD